MDPVKGRRATQAHCQRNSVADSADHVSIKGEKEEKEAAGLRRLMCDLCGVSVEDVSSCFSLLIRQHSPLVCVSLSFLPLYSVAPHGGGAGQVLCVHVRRRVHCLPSVLWHRVYLLRSVRVVNRNGLELNRAANDWGNLRLSRIRSVSEGVLLWQELAQ